MSLKTTYRVSDLPEEERPRERLLLYGEESLSASELVAIILGSGTRGRSVVQLAKELLATFGSLERLADASIEELCCFKGLGRAKAIQLKAAVSLGKRVSRGSTVLRPAVRTAQQAYALLRNRLEGEGQERVIVLLLDTKSCLIAQEMISLGTVAQVLVHPREVFHPAIRHQAASLILAHNHPSGDPTPSPEDKLLTRQLLAASRVMSIPLNDHLIIGKGTYVSLRDLWPEW